MNPAQTRRALAAVALAAALFGASNAKAERIVVLQFTGRKASVLRAKVAASLARAGHTVVRSKVSSRNLSEAALARVGKRADAVLAGKVESARQGDWRISLSVSDPKQAEQLGEEVLFTGESLKGLTRELSDHVSERLKTAMAGGAELRDAAATPESEPAPALAPPEPTALEAKAALAAPGPTPGESAVGPEERAAEVDTQSANDGLSWDGLLVRLRGRTGYVRRDFDFSDDIYDTLRTENANIWVYQAQAEVYLIRQRLGLFLSYEGALSGSVRDTDFDVTYPVIHSELFGGIRARHPLGQHEVGLDLGVGRMESGLKDENDAAGIPDLQYTLLRSSLDFKLGLGALDATGSIGFRLPLDFGEASQTRWFPRMGGYGVEASVGVRYPLSRHLSLEAIGSLRRYLIEMNSEPSDAINSTSQVAGGAIDRYLSGYVGVSFAL
jgi:hypothetical protein